MKGLGSLVVVMLIGLAGLSSASELDTLWPACDLEGPYARVDGGSEVGTIFDKFGHRVDFVYQRGGVPGDGCKRWRLYIGSRDWREGRLVERHSEEEELFIAFLQRWADDRISAEEQEYYLNFRTGDPEYHKSLREYLAGFSEEERRALAVVLLIDSIRHEFDRIKAAQEEMRERMKRSRDR